MEFRYRATDGQDQVVVGQIRAESSRHAARTLRQQGLTPLALHLWGGNRRPTRRRSRSDDKMFVIQELATLLRAGVTLGDAVRALAAARVGTEMGEALSRIDKGLRNGESFSQSLRGCGVAFPEYLYQLCGAGELTGHLDDALRNAATQMQYQAKIRQEVRNALIYPAVLVVSGIAATLTVFIFVVPKFAKLLTMGHADIPLMSKWVIGLGLYFNDHAGAIALAVAALLASAVPFATNPAWRSRGYSTLARAPVIGGWLAEVEVGRWATLLSALLESRVPLMQAMELAEKAAQLRSFQQKLQQARKEVRGGRRLADALGAAEVLEPTGMNLVKVGESSGELPAMLRTLSEIYDESGRQRMKRFLLLLEPMAILIIGGIIGTIMASIMLAITSINNVKF